MALENTSLRLLRAEKTGSGSDSVSDVEAMAGSLLGGLEPPNLLIAARNLLAGEALSSFRSLSKSEAPPSEPRVRVVRNIYVAKRNINKEMKKLLSLCPKLLPSTVRWRPSGLPIDFQHECFGQPLSPSCLPVLTIFP